MSGCEPPSGWERGAISAFASHGVNLHVDSGPASSNANGQPWGGLSRAGAIGHRADVPDWASFDSLKDERFVGSDRRRAFHYAAFVNRFEGNDGGKARGIPDADFVVAACEVPSTLGSISKSRYIASVFVHELGHNLGLQHGGVDGTIGKPSYNSVMNYFWAFLGGTSRDGRPRLLPSYSPSTRPTLDEREIDERAPHALPVAWICPGGDDLDIRYQFGSGAELIDWDCDGTYGERPYAKNLNGPWDPALTSMPGFNDWRPGAMRFDGQGVLGDFDVPVRSTPPASPPELTKAEFVAASRALARSTRRARRQLVVHASKRRLRSRKPVTIGLRVRAQRKRVRGAKIAVRGARLIGPRRAVTGRGGKVRVRVRPKRRGDIRIYAVRKGFDRGGIVVQVIGKKKKAKKRSRR
jgi:hypothetical protein